MSYQWLKLMCTLDMLIMVNEKSASLLLLVAGMYDLCILAIYQCNEALKAAAVMCSTPRMYLLSGDGFR